MQAEMCTEDPLQGCSRYSTVSYLSEGAFGFVVLAAETATKKQVSERWLCALRCLQTFPRMLEIGFHAGRHQIPQAVGGKISSSLYYGLYAILCQALRINCSCLRSPQAG